MVMQPCYPRLSKDDPSVSMLPATISDQDLIAAAKVIAERLGDITEQVILFGSVLTEQVHPLSDVDIAVIVPERPAIFSCAESKAQSEAAAILGRAADLSLFTRAEFEHNRRFHLNVEHAIAAGRVLLDAGRRAMYTIRAATLDELRQQAAQRMLDAGQLHLDRVLRWQDRQIHGLDHDACLDAVRAMCWAIRAQLVLGDVDTSTKGVRENPTALARLVTKRGIVLPPEALATLGCIADLRSFAHQLAGRHIPASEVVRLRDAAMQIFKVLVPISHNQASGC